MGNYEQLKQAVSNVIKSNGNKEITGDILQNTLLSIISTVGGNATFAGIATPSTNPGTPDGPVFYIATQVGIYSNFGGIGVANEEAVILQWDNGSWVKVISGLATTEIIDSVERYGYGINGSGLVVKDVDLILSPFITIPDGCKTLEWGTGGVLNASDFNSRPVYLCLYDENKNLIPTQAWFPNSDIRQIPLETGTKYIRFPVYYKNVANAYVKNDEYGVYYDFNGYAYTNKITTEIKADLERVNEIFNENGLDKLSYILRNINRSNVKENGNPSGDYSPFVLLYFSDIHNNAVNLNRIVQFNSKHITYINDMFVNGDIAGGNWDAYSDSMADIFANNKLLCSIGNHDVYLSDGGNATTEQCYDRYFANISNWGVTEPENNIQNKKCYYYKDYPASKIRFVVLDCMHYDNTQNEWFASVLSQSIENSFSVIAAQHIPVAMQLSEDVEPYNTPFNSIDWQADECTNKGQIDAVNTFINNGGEFVTWLFGHTHVDFCGIIKNTKQNYITVGAATYYANWSDTTRSSDDYTIDLFNLISVDTMSKTISVKRIGADYDRHLRRRDTMCIDYKQCKLLY